MKFNFIVNPVSGHLNAQQLLDLINLYRKQHPQFEFDIHLTQYEKHAISLAQQISGEDQVVIACGGDGTVNEVLNGLQPGVKFAILPIGTGNDFYRSLNGNAKIEFPSLLHETLEGKVVKVDFGRVNNEKFINVSNMGLDAEVVEEFNQLRGKIIPQSMIYTSVAIKKIFTSKPKTYTVQLDDQPPFDIEASLIAICNGRYYGGGYQPAPNSNLQDGFFDVSILSKASPLKFLSMLNKYKKGQQLSMKEFNVFKAKKVIISCDDLITYVNDGELRFSHRLEYQCNHQAVDILIPQRANFSQNE